jgi:hypothetical protein
MSDRREARVVVSGKQVCLILLAADEKEADAIGLALQKQLQTGGINMTPLGQAACFKEG